jgi:hypothetical protein
VCERRQRMAYDWTTCRRRGCWGGALGNKPTTSDLSHRQSGGGRSQVDSGRAASTRRSSSSRRRVGDRPAASSGRSRRSGRGSRRRRRPVGRGASQAVRRYDATAGPLGGGVPAEGDARHPARPGARGAEVTMVMPAIASVDADAFGTSSRLVRGRSAGSIGSRRRPPGRCPQAATAPTMGRPKSPIAVLLAQADLGKAVMTLATWRWSSAARARRYRGSRPRRTPILDAPDRVVLPMVAAVMP